MLATIDAIAERLTDERGLVYRYLRGDVDGLAGEEGTFLLCTFWLAQALALAGQVDRAARGVRAGRRVRQRRRPARRGGRPGTGELLGNFPQAFSHIGLVNAAWAIAQARSAPRRGQGLTVAASRYRIVLRGRLSEQLRVRVRRDDPGTRPEPDRADRRRP